MSLKLAPDSITADKAKKLAAVKFWKNLAADSSTAWGECKSNGLTYYKVAFSSINQSFKCNCASRKYPCKHALALNTLFKNPQEIFDNSSELPDWVKIWLEKGAPNSKVYTPEEEQAKAELRQKNFSKRLIQMTAGLEELENWLLDSLRQGLASLAQQPFSYWKEIAARLYDAKLGGIGKRIREIPMLFGEVDNWPEKVLAELTAYYLLLRSFRKMDELPLNIQQDLLTVAGVNTRKEDLFKYGQTVKDVWMVLGQLEGVEDRLNYRRTWILGFQTRRYGLILEYAFGKQPYPANYNKGNVFEGNIVFYPSNAPLRMIVKDKNVLDRTVKRIIGFPTFPDYLDFYAQSLAANPWQLSFPCSLEQVTPILDQQSLFLLDKKRNRISISLDQKGIWKILALSGGFPINIFGEWTGKQLIPLSLTINNCYISL